MKPAFSTAASAPRDPVASGRIDVSVLVVCRDDDERIGHLVRRVARHLGHLGLRGEILALDEGSGDNTVALLQLLRRELPSLEVLPHVRPGDGFVRGAALARGRALVLLDARSEPSLAPLGGAIERVSRGVDHSHDAPGVDVVVIPGRYVVLHRTRALRLHRSLRHHRDLAQLATRLLRRAGRIHLAVEVADGGPRTPPAWTRLRTSLLAPLARP